MTGDEIAAVAERLTKTDEEARKRRYRAGFEAGDRWARERACAAELDFLTGLRLGEPWAMVQIPTEDEDLPTLAGFLESEGFLVSEGFIYICSPTSSWRSPRSDEQFFQGVIDAAVAIVDLVERYNSGETG